MNIRLPGSAGDGLEVQQAPQPESRSRWRTLWQAARTWLASKGGFVVHPAPEAEHSQAELPI